MLAFRFHHYDREVPLKEQWTSRSDIGKEFAGTVLTERKYEITEATYLAALALLVDEMDSTSLRLTDILVPGESTFNEEGYAVSPPHARRALRVALREELSCVLRDAAGAYLFVAYDLYVHFGAIDVDKDPRPAIRALGLEVDDEGRMLDD